MRSIEKQLYEYRIKKLIKRYKINLLKSIRIINGLIRKINFELYKPYFIGSMALIRQKARLKKLKHGIKKI